MTTPTQLPNSYLSLSVLGSLLALACTSEVPTGTRSDPNTESDIWPAPDAIQTSSDQDELNPWLQEWFASGGATSSSIEAGMSAETAGVVPNPTDMKDNASELPSETEPLLRERPRVQITRYKEGKGADKRLHLFQLGQESVEACRLEIYANGSEKVWRTLVLPSPWEAQTELVICTANESSADCNVELSGSGYNGNDALILRCDDGLTQGGVVVDSFGRVGQDPGAAWFDPQTPEISSKDTELLRCATVSHELDSNAFDEFLIGDHWVRLAPDEEIEEALQRCPASQNLGGAGGGL